MRKRRFLSLGASMALAVAPILAMEHGDAKKHADEASGGVTLTVDSKGDLGPYLADEQGRALYLIEGAPANQSTCYGECAEVWPPVTVESADIEAGDPQVQEDLIGTIERSDGAKQLTYNGHALYYYVKDRGSKKATGQDYTDKWGEWYLVTPEGEHLESEGAGHAR